MLQAVLVCPSPERRMRTGCTVFVRDNPTLANPSPHEPETRPIAWSAHDAPFSWSGHRRNLVSGSLWTIHPGCHGDDASCCRGERSGGGCLGQRLCSIEIQQHLVDEDQRDRGCNAVHADLRQP